MEAASHLGSSRPVDPLDHLLAEAEEDGGPDLDFSILIDTGSLVDFDQLFESVELFGDGSAHFRAEDFDELVVVCSGDNNNAVVERKEDDPELSKAHQKDMIQPEQLPQLPKQEQQQLSRGGDGVATVIVSGARPRDAGGRAATVRTAGPRTTAIRTPGTRTAGFSGTRTALPLIFPKPVVPAAAVAALVEVARPTQFAPIAPAPPRYTVRN